MGLIALSTKLIRNEWLLLLGSSNVTTKALILVIRSVPILLTCIIARIWGWPLSLMAGHWRIGQSRWLHVLFPNISPQIPATGPLEIWEYMHAIHPWSHNVINETMVICRLYNKIPLSSTRFNSHKVCKAGDCKSFFPGSNPGVAWSIKDSKSLIDITLHGRRTLGLY